MSPELSFKFTRDMIFALKGSSLAPCGQGYMAFLRYLKIMGKDSFELSNMELASFRRFCIQRYKPRGIELYSEFLGWMFFNGMKAFAPESSFVLNSVCRKASFMDGCLWSYENAFAEEQNWSRGVMNPYSRLEWRYRAYNSECFFDDYLILSLDCFSEWFLLSDNEDLYLSFDEGLALYRESMFAWHDMVRVVKKNGLLVFSDSDEYL